MQYLTEFQILLQNSLYPTVLFKSKLIYLGLTMNAINENQSESEPQAGIPSLKSF